MYIHMHHSSRAESKKKAGKSRKPFVAKKNLSTRVNTLQLLKIALDANDVPNKNNIRNRVFFNLQAKQESNKKLS